MVLIYCERTIGMRALVRSGECKGLGRLTVKQALICFACKNVMRLFSEPFLRKGVQQKRQDAVL